MVHVLSWEWLVGKGADVPHFWALWRDGATWQCRLTEAGGRPVEEARLPAWARALWLKYFPSLDDSSTTPLSALPWASGPADGPAQGCSLRLCPTVMGRGINALLLHLQGGLLTCLAGRGAVHTLTTPWQVHNTLAGGDGKPPLKRVRYAGA
ncbi:hypothetical protein P7K49_012862 [Saguinus oedipus]|uniref:Uncharacterized protein n=1 Tax=Saguinus oedipus TaxID=9490 RepID=A0ABQ9VEN2_SAGOE|nr:hypothetical protein P7K49_012862 [Saguinus oedipus]